MKPHIDLTTGKGVRLLMYRELPAGDPDSTVELRPTPVPWNGPSVEFVLQRPCTTGVEGTVRLLCLAGF